MNITIKEELNRLDGLPVECDGMTRLVVTLLERHQQPFQAFYGAVTVGESRFEHHFWVVTEGCIIDYRARMWLGDDAPHGVFSLKEFGHCYSGEPVVVSPLSPALEAILKLPIPWFPEAS